MTDYLLTFSGSAIAVFGVCLIAVSTAVHGHGAFGQWAPEHVISRDAALQFFLGFHILALFPASVLQLERNRLAEVLRAANAKLMALASLYGLERTCNPTVSR